MYDKVIFNSRLFFISKHFEVNSMVVDAYATNRQIYKSFLPLSGAYWPTVGTYRIDQVTIILQTTFSSQIHDFIDS